MKAFKNYNLIDFFKAYVNQLLSENPDYYCIRKHGTWAVYRPSRRGPIEIISRKTFSAIVRNYFAIAGEKMIEGKSVNLLSGLGSLEIKRIERNPANMRIDWGSSLIMKQQMINNGEPLTEVRPMKNMYGEYIRDAQGNIRYKEYKTWVVYFTDEEYLKLEWKRVYPRIDNHWCRAIPNIAYYEFKPCVSRSTMNSYWNKVMRAFKENPTLLGNIKYYSISA